MYTICINVIIIIILYKILFQISALVAFLRMCVRTETIVA